MRFGLRGILLIAAVLLFILALFLDDNALDLLFLGLAAFAGAELVGELPMGAMGPNRGGDTTLGR